MHDRCSRRGMVDTSGEANWREAWWFLMRGTFASEMGSRFMTLRLQFFPGSHWPRELLFLCTLGWGGNMYGSPRSYVCQKHGRAFVLAMFLVVRRHRDAGPLISLRFVFNKVEARVWLFCWPNRASTLVHSPCSICMTGSSCLPPLIVLSVKRCAGDRWDGYWVLIVPYTVLELN